MGFITKLKNRNGKYSTLSKNVLLFTISSFGSKIISFLLVPLYTYVLSTREYGTVDLISSTAMLLIPILTVDIQDAVLRFTLDKHYDTKDVISTGVVINIIGSVILLIGVFLLKIIGIIRLSESLIAFLFLSYVFGSLNNCFTLYLKGKNKVSVIVIAGLLNTVIMCVLNILLLLVFKFGLMGYLIANIAGVSTAVVYEFFIGTIFRDIHLKRCKNTTKAMLSYSRSLVVNSLAWWINSVSDRYILTFMSGVAANGIYSVSYKVPTILTTVQNVFYNAWSISAITEYDREDTDGFIGNMYSLYSLMSILACSIILIMNIPIARILYSKDFFVAWRYVPFLLVGAVFNGISLFQGCIFTAVKQTKDLSRSTLIGAIVNTICNFIFIYFIGALGAAFATMIGYFVTWIIRTKKLTKIVHMKVDWKQHFINCAIIVFQSFLALNAKLWPVQIICVISIIIIQKEYFNMLISKIRKSL